MGKRTARNIKHQNESIQTGKGGGYTTSRGPQTQLGMETWEARRVKNAQTQPKARPKRLCPDIRKNTEIENNFACAVQIVV